MHVCTLKKYLQRLNLKPVKEKVKLILFDYDILVIFKVKSNNKQKVVQTNNIRVKNAGPERLNLNVQGCKLLSSRDKNLQAYTRMILRFVKL